MKSIILVGSFLAIVFVLNIGNAEAKAVPETENPVEPEGGEYQEAPRAGKTFYKYKTYHQPSTTRYWNTLSNRYHYRIPLSKVTFYDRVHDRYGRPYYLAKRSVDEENTEAEELDRSDESEEPTQLEEEGVDEENAREGRTFSLTKNYYPSSTRYYPRYYSSYSPRYYSSYTPRRYYDNSYVRRYGTTHFIGKRSADEADQKTEEQEDKDENDELKDEEIEELNAAIKDEQELAAREKDATEIDEPRDGKTYYKYKSYYPSSTRYHSRYYSSNYPRYYSSYYPRSYSRYYPRYTSRYYPRYSSSYYQGKGTFRTYYHF